MFSKGKFNIVINGGNTNAEGGGTGAALGCGAAGADTTEYSITVNSALGIIAGDNMSNMNKITEGTISTERLAVISDGNEVYTVTLYNEQEAVCGTVKVPYGYPLDKLQLNELNLGYTVYQCYHDVYFSNEWNFETDYITSDTEIYVIWQRDETRYFMGDVNGDGVVNVSDCVCICMYDAGKKDLMNIQLEAADVTYDGKVDIDDAQVIAQFIAGLIFYL